MLCVCVCACVCVCVCVCVYAKHGGVGCTNANQTNGIQNTQIIRALTKGRPRMLFPIHCCNAKKVSFAAVE